MRRFLIVLTLLAVTVSPRAFAQALADRVPDDALIYIGWRGVDDPGPGYDQSRTKAFLDASAIPELINQFVPKALDKMAEKDPGAAIVREVIGKLGPAFWRYPTAIYIGPVEGIGVGQPMPRFALFCNAGAGAIQLKKDINTYLDQIPNIEFFPAVAIEENGMVALTIGNIAPELSGKARNTLPYRKEFVDAMSHVGKDPMLAVYVDVEGITKLIDNAIVNAPADAGQKWTSFQEVIGLKGLNRIVWTAGLDGRDWSTQAFINAPSPRTGLMQLLDAGPITDDALKAVPQSATMLSAGKLDFAKLLNVARTAVGRFDVSAPDKINSGLAVANLMLGINIESDLLQALGDEWIAYTAPTVGGVGPLGLVIVNHARDAKKLESSLIALETVINKKINSESESGKPRGNFVKTTVGDLTIHYLNTPLLTPSWAVKNGNLYIGLYPQVVATAAGVTSGKSILDNEDFQGMRKRIGGGNASAISFFDLPRSAPVGYPYMLMASHITGFADMFGMPTPAMVFPSIEKLTPLLTSAGGATWTDDMGLHMKSVSPFPGATMIGGPEMILFDGPVASGFVVAAMRNPEHKKAAATIEKTN